MKRQVRSAEGNYKHMHSVLNIIPCIKVLSNTETIVVSYDEIQACDEPSVSAVGGPWIKKYHHMVYVRPGVVKCSYIKGDGVYKEERMKQSAGEFGATTGTSSKDICGICEEDYDDDDDGRTWIQCETCHQWFHCDCAEVGDSVLEDDFDLPFSCDDCGNNSRL